MNRSLLQTAGCALATLLGMALLSSGCAAQGTIQGALGGAKQATQSPTTLQTTSPNVSEALNDPTKATLVAPATFKVKFETTKGDFVIQINKQWSPNGADRFYNMVKAGFFKDTAIFRAIKGFMFQFGIHGTPAIAQKWGSATIKDDPAFPGASNIPGTICFAKTGRPNSRSSQMFINLGPRNSQMLDPQGFTPFGQVIEGMNVVTAINTEYGENVGNVQGDFKQLGNAYIKQKFPNIDYIKSVTIVQ